MDERNEWSAMVDEIMWDGMEGKMWWNILRWNGRKMRSRWGFKCNKLKFIVIVGFEACQVDIMLDYL